MTKESKHAEHRLLDVLTAADLRAARLYDGRAHRDRGEASGLTAMAPTADAPAKAIGPLRAALRRFARAAFAHSACRCVISIVTGDHHRRLDHSCLILTISIGLDTVQEGHAVRTAEILRRSVALKAEVKRDGVFQEIEVEGVVPGDVLRVPLATSSRRIADPANPPLTAGEAALTAKPYPVPNIQVSTAEADDTSNALFRGSVAQTGEAIALG